jgi:hypothetical protein
VPPSPSVGAERVSKHERVEPVVLACGGLIALSSSRGSAGADREDLQIALLEPLDKQPFAALNRNPHQSGQACQRTDQLIDTFTIMSEPAVPDLSSIWVDHRHLMMGATPVDTGEQLKHELPLRA